MQDFNIFAQLNKELQSFDNDQVLIASSNDSGSVRMLSQAQKGYSFSQKDTLNLIDLYYNSKFDSGEVDSEGQRKTFLNICKFRSDVAAKQVDLDVKDFKFIPEDPASVWGAYFITKQFKIWTKSVGFGQIINDLIQDYTKYGTCVAKKVKDGIERTNIRTLKVQQDAKDLQTATFVIEEHKEMSIDDMLPAWDTEQLDLEFGTTKKIYERYGKVPVAYLKRFREEEVQDEDYAKGVDVMAILTLEAPKRSNEDFGGTILFMEEVKDRPYEEAHWSKQDGRWLGIGEIENQFENQIMRNMIANMRRRGLLWSSKKIFQSKDTEVARNLVKEVRDGDVMSIGPGGEISQVNMTTQSLVEFSNAEAEWEKNSDQKSFTFEVATGEALPSGTPFRLGVVLSNAVNSHFGLKRENLGLFFKRVIENQTYPTFKKKNNREHTLTLFADEEGVGLLKQALIKLELNGQAKAQILKGIIPNMDELKAKIAGDIESRKQLFVKMAEGFYKDLKVGIELVITGESVDIAGKLETLTTLYNALSQKQDPRADAVLEKILSLTGENFEALAGAAPAQQPAQVQAAQAFNNPQAVGAPAEQTV